MLREKTFIFLIIKSSLLPQGGVAEGRGGSCCDLLFVLKVGVIEEKKHPLHLQIEILYQFLVFPGVLMPADLNC